MIEAAMVLPIFIVVMFITLDICRGAYTWVIIGQDAEVAARQATLPDNRTSDCSSIDSVETAGNGITIKSDPDSYMGGGTASGAPSQSNAGYLFINAPQASASPPDAAGDANCSNTTPTTGARGHGTVTAQITFNFVPWTPIASQFFPALRLTASSTEATQY